LPPPPCLLRQYTYFIYWKVYLGIVPFSLRIPKLLIGMGTSTLMKQRVWNDPLILYLKSYYGFSAFKWLVSGKKKQVIKWKHFTVSKKYMKTFQLSVVNACKKYGKMERWELFWLNYLHLLKNAKSIFG